MLGGQAGRQRLLAEGRGAGRHGALGAKPPKGPRAGLSHRVQGRREPRSAAGRCSPVEGAAPGASLAEGTGPWSSAPGYKHSPGPGSHSASRGC